MLLSFKKKQGQAILEYVLLLTVAVFVTGALVLKLNKGFGNWAKSFIGNDGYIACLLQTGQLPKYAGQICPKDPIDIDLTLSNQQTTSTAGEATSTTSGGEDETANAGGIGGGAGSSSNKSGQEGLLDHELSSSASSSRGLKKGKNRRKRTASSNPNGNLIPQTGAGGSSVGAEEDENNEEGGGGGGRRKKKRMGFRDDFLASKGKPGYKGRRFRAIQSYGAFGQDREEKKIKQKPIAVTGSAKKKNQLTGSNKRSYLVKKSLKKKTEEVKVGKWSFGNMFRIILIICVIATVVLLIGGQVTQVKKSMK